MNNSSNPSDGNVGRTGFGAYLSPLAVLALSFGYAVGWGAFILPGSEFLPDAGPLGTIVGIVIGAAAMVVFAFNYHRLVVRHPGPGGAYGFVANVFGTDHGFLVAWFLFLTYIAILWANSTALVIVARYILGDALQFGWHYKMVGFDVYLGEVLLSILAIALCGGACLFRKRLAVGLHTLFAGAMVVGIAFCFFAVLLKHEGGLASMAPAFSSNGHPAVQILRILAMIPWAFVGFEAVVHSSGELKFPVRRLYPLMIAAIVLAALSYALLAILPTLSIPDGFASWSEYIAALPGLKGTDSLPVFAAVRRSLGSAGTAILGGTMLAAQLTGIFATFVATSRLMHAMSNGGMIPRWFGALNRDGTPANAVLFVMCVSAAIPFFGRTVIGWPVDVSNLGAAIAYGYTSAAALAVSRKNGRAFVPHAAGICGIVMAIVFCLLMLVPNYLSGSTLSAESYLLLSIWCLLGFLLYRHVFRMDTQGRFGHSTVVWVSVLVMIFFSSLMWFRLAICDAAENAFGSLAGKTLDKSTFNWLVGHVDSDILLKSVVELCLLVSSLTIMLSLFSILRRREKSLIEEKLKAEESANKSKSYFFSTVSHDIRTPLNAIIGFSQMLKMGFKTQSERDQAIDSILVSGKTLLCLINDVLDFSKLEDGRMEIVPEPTDCGRLLKEIIDTFRIANKKPALEFRCRADDLPILMVDPQRIRQLLFNLVGNAAKFTQSGFVEVRASFTRADGADSGTFRLDVEDTGCGIGEEDLKRIASPYVQVRSKVARHGGTGLGLAICRQLVGAMGGKMDISSTSDKGSTFAITIPDVKMSDKPPADEPKTEFPAFPDIPEMADVPQSQEPPPSAPPQEPPPSAPKRILIVDDQRMNLMVLKTMLKKLGPFDVAMAADGAEALKMLEAPSSAPFDRVLTDMWMPELGGDGLVKAIQANARLAKIPVYVVTADVEMLNKFESAGFTGILLKPITVDKLKAII